MRFLIVAECGVAWKGEVALAKEMILNAKLAGADAAKFQLFTEKEIADSPYYDQLKEMILTPALAKELKEHADTLHINWFASATYHKAIDLLKQLDVKYIKIREKDSQNTRLISKALSTQKTILISTTKKVYNTLINPLHPKIRWLYCIPKYPPKISEFDWSFASTLNGVSSHFPHITYDLAAAVLAIWERAKTYIIEKHVMLKGLDCLDKNVSITFNQLKELVNHVRRLEQLTVQQ